MSDSDTHNIDRPTVRRTVRKVVRGSPVDVADVVERTAVTLDCPEHIVRDELDALEREGFVYLVGDGDSAEVRLP
jgi:hypothetical protein